MAVSRKELYVTYFINMMIILHFFSEIKKDYIFITSSTYMIFSLKYEQKRFKLIIRHYRKHTVLTDKLI